MNANLFLAVVILILGIVGVGVATRLMVDSVSAPHGFASQPFAP